MNRRQKKKAYKKKYGHNPPKTEVQYHYKEWGRMAARAAEGIAEGLRHIIPAIAEMAARAAEMARETIEHIKTMPEEDFNRFLESPELDERAKVMARQIRRTGQNGLHTSNNSAERTSSEAASAERRTPDY